MAVVYNSRGALGWLSAGLAAIAGAALYAFATVYSGSTALFLIYFAFLPLFLCGLGTGCLNVVIASALSTLFLLVGVNEAISFTYFVLFAVPSILLLFLATRYRTNASNQVFWYPESNLVLAAVAYPCFLFVAANFYSSFGLGEEDGLLGLSLRSLGEIITAIDTQVTQDQAAQGVDADTIAQYAEGMKALKGFLPKVAEVLPSILGVTWFFLVLVSAVVSQNILQQQKWNIRTAFRLITLEAPQSLLVLVAVCGTGAYLLPDPYAYILLNLAIMLCVPFFLVGLAISHGYAATTKSPRLVLFLVYLMLSAIPWLALLVTALGVADIKFHFRQRMKSLPQSI